MPASSRGQAATTKGKAMTRNAARPRRSVLYMPGANARALEKARDLDADEPFGVQNGGIHAGGGEDPDEESAGAQGGTHRL